MPVLDGDELNKRRYDMIRYKREMTEKYHTTEDEHMLLLFGFLGSITTHRCWVLELKMVWCLFFHDNQMLISLFSFQACPSQNV
jgi:hypothetical protein